MEDCRDVAQEVPFIGTEEKCEELLFTFNQHLRNKYDRYYFVFVGCEALNLMLVLCQLWLTNNFLGRTLKYFDSLFNPND